MRACLRRHGLEGQDKLLGLVDCSDGQPKPRTGNAIITCGWETFRAHLAGWLLTAYLLDPKVRLGVLTDAEIRSLWLGHRVGGETQNAASCLDDLRQHDLVVVRLRPVRHKATVPALIETMDHARSLWLVDDPALRFAPGHPGWSDDMAYVLSDFDRIVLGPADEDDIDLDAAMGVSRG